MIRPIQPSDIPRLRELEKEFKWDIESESTECLVYVDGSNVPQMFVGAWLMAEVHATVNSEWQTPGVRMEAFRQLHEAMERRLQQRRVGRVVTWFDSEKEKKDSAFLRRLKSFFWVKCDMTAWVRKVG